MFLRLKRNAESCSHERKALDAENDSRKTEITPHEINPEEQCWSDAYYTREASLGKMQNLVHTNAKLTGKVEKVFVHES
jgi:hypothetical protein